VFREKLERRALLGLLVGFAGVGLLLRPGAGLDPLGLALLIGSNVSWALGAVLAPRLRLPEDPRVAAGSELLGGGFVLLLVAAALGTFNGLDLGAVTPQSWAGFGWMIVVGVGGFTAYGYLARTVSCSVATTFSYVNPVVAITLGFLLFGEPVTIRMVIAVAVIVVGVCLIVSTRARSPCNPVHPFTSGVGHVYIVRGHGRPMLLVDVPTTDPLISGSPGSPP
jgi:drug/metabolite transporter (DMT)-like permease